MLGVLSMTRWLSSILLWTKASLVFIKPRRAKVQKFCAIGPHWQGIQSFLNSVQFMPKISLSSPPGSLLSVTNCAAAPRPALKPCKGLLSPREPALGIKSPRQRMWRPMGSGDCYSCLVSQA